MIDFDLTFLSGFFVVLIIVFYAWKSGFFKKQFEFAENLPTEIDFKQFFILMFKNSKVFVINYFKWLFSYVIKILWYLLILNTIYNSSNDFELTMISGLAIVMAKITLNSKSDLKSSKVIVLSPEEHERILKGKAKLKDFEQQS